MKTVKKVIALSCVLSMAACFASCKPDNPAEGSTTAPVVTETQQPVTETTTEITEALTTEQTQPVTQAPTTTVPAQKTAAEIIAIFNDAHNNTKAAGNFFGTNNTTATEIYLNGKLNGALSPIVSMAIGLFNKSIHTNPLPPAALATSQITESDLLSVDFKDNGATYYIKLVPIDGVNITPGSAGPGRVFEPLPDIAKDYLEPYGLTWTSGTRDDNVKLEYSGGYCEATIDKATNRFISATYSCKGAVHIDNGKFYGQSINQAKVPMETITVYPATR